MNYEILGIWVLVFEGFVGIVLALIGIALKHYQLFGSTKKRKVFK